MCLPLYLRPLHVSSMNQCPLAYNITTSNKKLWPWKGTEPLFPQPHSHLLIPHIIGIMHVNEWARMSLRLWEKFGPLPGSGLVNTDNYLLAQP